MVVLFSIGADNFALYVTSIFVVTFFITLFLFALLQDNGRYIQPTIGFMWDLQPNNFISRFAVGIGCVGLYYIQYIILQANQNRWPKDKHKRLISALFYTAIFAVFCLSIMACVCSNDDGRECRGNSRIYSFAKLGFYFPYSIYIAGLLYLEKYDPRATMANNRLLWFLVASSIICKVRYFESMLSAVHLTTQKIPQSISLIAMLEWFDYLSFMSFTAKYVASKSSNFGIALIRSKESSVTAKEDIHNFSVTLRMDGNRTNKIAVYVCIGVLSACFVASLLYGDASVDTIPFISDTFVYSPGNSISRWGGHVWNNLFNAFSVSVLVCL